MRRSTTTFLAATVAFGLTAASAAVTSFTVTATDEAQTAFATTTFTEGYCTGAYTVEFTRDENGEVDGGTATRTAPEGTDTNLASCADEPAYIELWDPVNIPASSSDPNFGNYYTAAYVDGTNADGGFTFTFGGSQSPIDAVSGWSVRVQIGPDAAGLPLPQPQS